MIIVIDGYNVLKQLISRDVTDAERKQFIAQLGKYARYKKHKIILVFDGGPYEWPHKERISGIKVIYSGIHESADDYIMRYLDDHRSRDLLLVSSDHELNVWSSRLEIPSMDSSDFYGLLQEALRVDVSDQEALGGEVVKITDQESELDEIMQEASKVVPIKAEDVVASVKHDRSSPARKQSKKDRKLMKKLKKL